MNCSECKRSSVPKYLIYAEEAHVRIASCFGLPLAGNYIVTVLEIIMIVIIKEFGQLREEQAPKRYPTSKIIIAS